VDIFDTKFVEEINTRI